MGKKELICHIPPGNPANAHTICVGDAAVEPHQTHHGDTLGACATEPTPPPEEPPPPDDCGGTCDDGGGDGSGSGSGGSADDRAESRLAMRPLERHACDDRESFVSAPCVMAIVAA